MKLLVVGLDFDGVVADSYDVFFEAMATAFAYEGKNLTQDDFYDIFETGMWANSKL